MITVLCIRAEDHGGPEDRDPPGDCPEKIRYSIDRGTFPKGHLVVKEQGRVGANEVTYYELHSGVGGIGGCGVGDVAFRSSVEDRSGNAAVKLSLGDGGFVYAGVPASSPDARWLFAFNSSRGQHTIVLAANSSAKFQLGSQRFSVLTDQCRTLIEKDVGPFMTNDLTTVLVNRL